MNNETCVLATLRLGSWSGKKLDRAAANALETQTHSGAGTYEARKTLVSKTWLDRIQRQDTLIRSTFQQFTLAYPATSVRMVPLSAKERLDNCMAALFLERRNIIDANLAGPYQDEIRTAPERLKDAAGPVGGEVVGGSTPCAVGMVYSCLLGELGPSTAIERSAAGGAA